MVAGAQDKGTIRFTCIPKAWIYIVIGGDGGFCAADQTDPNFHGRHNRRGNVGWLDGSVRPIEPTYFNTYNGGQDPALLKQLRIGDIDRDGDNKTNEMYIVE